jgi:alginate O-acetyltransferase complex protein AlgI
MLFNSYVFIFIFLPVVLGGYIALRRLPNVNWAIGWLALASLFFYAWWKPIFLLILLLSIAVNFAFGTLLLRARLSPGQAWVVLIAGITFNLCLLGYFKYAGFFVSNVNSIFGSGWAVPQILLPIGISFITFQKIAFLVDAYRGQVHNFTPINYVLFVTFFPQLIAGPIVHHAELMPQLARFTQRELYNDLSLGLSIFIVGLFKKVVVADTLAVYADAGYGAVATGHALDAPSAWITVLAYSFQLYYDFSGYSDMAVGLARMFGIKLPINFFSPYKAYSITDLWRRWHITLSRFLRDYLYIPLGGNRRGPRRQYAHLAAVMLLGGLWHGANWTFAIWGGVHGILLAINHAWSATTLSGSRFFQSRLAYAASVALTFTLVTLAWIPFRAPTLADSVRMLRYLFPSPLNAEVVYAWVNSVLAQFVTVWKPENVGVWFKAHELWPTALPANYLAYSALPAGLVLLTVAIATFSLPNTYQLFARFDPALWSDKKHALDRGPITSLNAPVAIVLSAMFVLSVLGLSRVSPFLYFQF